MPAESHLLKRAVFLFRQGDLESAQRLFLGVLQGDPGNEYAWLMYGHTFPRPQRIEVYQDALAQFPALQRVQQELQALCEEEEQINRVAQARRAAESRRVIEIRGEDVSQPAARPGRVLPGWTVFMIVVLVAVSLVVVWLFNDQSGRIGQLGQQVNQLTRQNEGLQAQNQGLQATNLQLLDNIKRVTADLLAKTRQNKDLTGLFNTLQKEHKTLQDSHAKLQAEHKDLQAKHANLQNQYNQLQADHNKLSSDHQELITRFDGLTNQYSTLSGQYNNLKSNYNQLMNQYNGLKQISVTPPYITVKGRNVTMAFRRTNGSLVSWTVPFDELETDIERGNSARQGLKWPWSKMVLNGKNGNQYSVVDFRPYVDPQNFREISGNLYRSSPSEQYFLNEVWYMVAQLTTYSNEVTETPRYPMETLLAGGGDCEDTAILYASMIKAAPVNWKVSLVYLNAYNTNEAVEPNHVIVKVNTDADEYLVETTSKEEMNPYPNGVAGWALEIN